MVPLRTWDEEHIYLITLSLKIYAIEIFAFPIKNFVHGLRIEVTIYTRGGLIENALPVRVERLDVAGESEGFSSGTPHLHV
jgi:hypothetical protein